MNELQLSDYLTDEQKILRKALAFGMQEWTEHKTVNQAFRMFCDRYGIKISETNLNAVT